MPQDRFTVKARAKLKRLDRKKARAEVAFKQLGKHATAKVRTHKATLMSTATWPTTPDQRNQSRPLIVTKPVKRLMRLINNKSLVRNFSVTKNISKQTLSKLCLTHHLV